MMMMMMHSGGIPRCMLHVSTLGIEQTRQPSMAKRYGIATYLSCRMVVWGNSIIQAKYGKKKGRV